MKILYIGSERTDARGVVTALHRIAENVTVSVLSRVDHAAEWLDENRDLAALVVEAGIDGGAPSILEHLPDPRRRPAVVVIVPEGTGSPFDALELGADDYVPRNDSLLHDLPLVVALAIERVQGRRPMQPASNGGVPDARVGADDERAARADLGQKLAQATAALQEAEHRHLAAMAAATEQLAQRQAQYEIAMSRAAATWEMVDEQLRAAALEVERARQERASAVAAADRLSRRESELSLRLDEAVATHQALAIRIADAERAIEAANARAEHEQLAAAARLAGQQREFEAQIAREVDERRSVEGMLTQAVSALDEAEKRHAHDLESKGAEVERLTKREADLTATLADAAASEKALERRLAAMDATFQDASTRATRERLAASKRAAEREAELDGQIRQERAARATLEQAVADGEAALREAKQRHDAELAAAAREIAERQADFETRLAHERDTCSTLEHTLAETRSAASEATRSFQDQIDAVRARGLEQEARFEVQLAQQQLEHEDRLATLTARLGETERTLEDARRDSREALDRLSREHALEVSALGALVAERDAQLQEQAVRQREIESLQDTLAATTQELTAATHRRNALQAEADQVPHLQQQLDESRVENERLFLQAQLAMFRCTPDGALAQANRACMSLTGRRTLDELRSNFAAAVFEAPDNLSSLIERCLSTRTKETIETTWRRVDGRRLFVRLSGCLSAPDVIEVVVEDLTRLRVLQERRDQALRMEAVGRLASEVAATCSTLLGDVHRHMREWLLTTGDAASRRQGERLLDDVTRAAGFLQQLAGYGDEQARTPALVDVNDLIRDLGPVLKRVAGADVEMRMPEGSSELNVDVAPERVERLLVNLASHSRSRMPFGGQLRVEIETSVVDEDFAARHPNVRLGHHVLITVREIRRAARADAELSHRDGTASDGIDERVAQKPGMDFGTLQQLVGECGGHLWMTIEPRGDMITKIRLPLLASVDETPPGAMAAGVGHARAIRGWFQH